MEIRSSYQNQGQTLIIDVGTKFDFSKVEDFRNAYDKIDDDVSHIAVDLSQTEYMDSSALGMLLNMQKSLANKELSYSIENARPQVAKILKISRFDKKFDIK
ncbi:STAS domain-containing protein [Alteromonas mediterranea]|jgi:HptB-dependent secretion and biofilm anti anti-sigma factor|uniref:Anti-sigma factor antagonist n=1 Tax=Alteromonas mediterranea TaxID=314275 RepID=A0AAC8XJ41_9ALTE|nr:MULTISPECIES: STAS domain-containing protein [Alteromonas]MBR9783423.1 STAS domain-containing protein [Gammaproteobacteria bacterium]MEA3379677.1 STAS domain-containing protein [Pseudomonadota bacterium]AFV84878.1 putative anti-sigma factor antagonist [Alteromonas mediterranea DE1]AGP81274.1 anti-sigma factor antagonist [Alteromonas mediterranea MED64]AGP96888.1 anti-sigma factor antagonist [Alteromonas mediterranea UM7]|tara:strand:+ start:325 stop:630 length:306 start_codon:yes stop_codon:yes gene_type:complete